MLFLLRDSLLRGHYWLLVLSKSKKATKQIEIPKSIQIGIPFKNFYYILTYMANVT